MRVLFIIPRDPPPKLRERAAWYDIHTHTHTDTHTHIHTHTHTGHLRHSCTVPSCPVAHIGVVTRNCDLTLRPRRSINFHDFVSKALVKDPRTRPTAVMLLQHKFPASAPSTAVLAELVQRAKMAIARRAQAQAQAQSAAAAALADDTGDDALIDAGAHEHVSLPYVAACVCLRLCVLTVLQG